MVNKRQTDLFYEWLDNYLNYERIPKKGEFSLETMKFLIERFKHPETSFNSVHVAGSKGKGSISAMIANIIQTSGIQTGLYTSPHMNDFAERVSTPVGLFPDEIYAKACDIIVPLVDSIIPDTIPGNIDPTWFELVTLFAFIVFREAGMPWAVIETGLGGRLDATNVIIPKACVLTPIELEHTEYLGNTIEKIAFEKAGIIKEGIPVFIAKQKSMARNIFEQEAKKKHSLTFSMDDAVKRMSANITEGRLDVSIEFNWIPGGPTFARPIRTSLAMPSEIQAENAALAAYTAKYLFPDINEGDIEAGLSRAWLPGRFEIITPRQYEDMPIVLDGAHTIQSVKITLETFKKIYTEKAHLLFACAADKDVDSIAALFVEGFSRITVTRPGEKKSSDIDRAGHAFTRLLEGHREIELIIDGDYEYAIKNSIQKAKKTLVPLLVIGSFYLVSEVKKILALAKTDQGN